jgi:hypothetical protein
VIVAVVPTGFGLGDGRREALPLGSLRIKEVIGVAVGLLAVEFERCRVLVDTGLQVTDGDRDVAALQ